MPGTLHLIRKGDCRHDQCRRNCMMHRRSVLQKARLEDRHAIGFRLISPSIIVRPGPNSPWGHDVRVPKGNGRRSFPRTRYPSGPFRKTRMIYRERSAPIPFDRRDRNPRKSVRSRNRFHRESGFSNIFLRRWDPNFRRCPVSICSISLLGERRWFPPSAVSCRCRRKFRAVPWANC